MSRTERLDLRGGISELEKLLRSDNNERLSEVSSKLSSENVEVVSSSTAVNNRPVVVSLVLIEVVSFEVGDDIGIIIAHLEISLHSGRGVLGTLAIISVRKEHDESRGKVPLSLSTSDVLIDNRLGTVGEITELGLPQGKSVRVSNGISIFEPENTLL